MTLTEACKPRIFTDKDWYKETSKSLQNFQREAAARDDEEKQKQRQVYLDQLITELAELKTANESGALSLINCILEKFPPKVTNKRFAESDKQELEECENYTGRSKTDNSDFIILFICCLSVGLSRSVCRLVVQTYRITKYEAFPSKGQHRSYFYSFFQ